MLDQFTEGFAMAMRLDTVALMSFGLFAGMLVGALPGFTTLMAMAILLPISFFLEPVVGIPFLLGIYKGGIFGGSVPAILISMPGTGASVATSRDGYKLTQKGQSRKALDMALVSSVFGDTASDIFTIAMIFPIAFLVMQFGPPELFAVLLMSLVVIAATSGSNPVKSLMMIMLGLWLSFIGTDPLGGVERFTFGLFDLKSGIPLLPMLIGVFALPEVASVVIRNEKARKLSSLVGERLKWPELRRCIPTIGRSTVIGTMIGIVPGLGQIVAAMMGYSAAKNASKHPETFGEGELEGVAAAEAANNAVNGPTMVPLLTLGIPGDNVTAILLGAFVAQGLRPGPQLFEEQGATVFAILVAMVIANLLFLVIGYLSIPFFSRLVTIRTSVLIPLVIMFAFAGTYVYRSDPVDLLMLVGFGIFGIIARSAKFDVMPMVMGFILGPSMEYAFGQTMAMSGGDTVGFFMTERIGALCVLVVTPVIGFLLWKRLNARTVPA
ncbi:tripartite tricarboxylate transporter permease [Citreicella sp. C3M06]|uniref:tripartite tricarboxylate transporter permease n=1 Tax=Roseobacteraceae TaxID=2854170 RepID=UPI001C09C7AF|nr:MULTISPECIES: tripartite tricarboxylate transporter permease [Roseobacteraceae]MBU2959268.1 tripartite tricarboxylate transporter permease [Citreicella sp. C3M06]MDO6585201.1 tripartite tricarboxylate transporter permease [Salipiger sp. 1_MG-2023]